MFEESRVDCVEEDLKTRNSGKKSQMNREAEEMMALQVDKEISLYTWQLARILLMVLLRITQPEFCFAVPHQNAAFSLVGSFLRGYTDDKDGHSAPHDRRTPTPRSAPSV